MGENLFEEEFTIEALSQMGNPLERLAALVDFEMFRPALEEVWQFVDNLTLALL